MGQKAPNPPPQTNVKPPPPSKRLICEDVRISETLKRFGERIQETARTAEEWALMGKRLVAEKECKHVLRTGIGELQLPIMTETMFSRVRLDPGWLILFKYCPECGKCLIQPERRTPGKKGDYKTTRLEKLKRMMNDYENTISYTKTNYNTAIVARAVIELNEKVDRIKADSMPKTPKCKHLSDNRTGASTKVVKPKRLENCVPVRNVRKGEMK